MGSVNTTGGARAGHLLCLSGQVVPTGEQDQRVFQDLWTKHLLHLHGDTPLHLGAPIREETQNNTTADGMKVLNGEMKKKMKH